MTAPSGYRLVDLPRERGREMLEVDSWAFAFWTRPSEVEAVLDRFPFERGRAVEISDSSQGVVGALAGVHSSFEFRMRVPGGGTIPAAGLTWVGVHQGHRRRGLLTAMIWDHFARARGRGEPVSTLYAAEPGIYQRFGYGLASRDLRMKLGRKAELREVARSDDLRVALETASPEVHGPILRAFQETYPRPGSNTNVPEPLLLNLLRDAESDREGSEPLRFVTVSDGARTVAWAAFRRKGDGNDWDPNGVVNVRGWGATSAASSRRLWSVLTDLDLMASTHTWLVPMDDPLLHLLVDERATKADIRDNLWVRVLDVKAALEGRGYEADADVVVEVSDSQIPENVGPWRVAIAGGSARVSPAEGAKPDVRLAIQELGAAYLGGVSIEALAGAGLVTELTPGAVQELGRAMWGSLAPVNNITF